MKYLILILVFLGGCAVEPNKKQIVELNEILNK